MTAATILVIILIVVSILFVSPMLIEQINTGVVTQEAPESLNSITTLATVLLPIGVMIPLFIFIYYYIIDSSSEDGVTFERRWSGFSSTEQNAIQSEIISMHNYLVRGT